jgi:hypothetical protein
VLTGELFKGIFSGPPTPEVTSHTRRQQNRVEIISLPSRWLQAPIQTTICSETAGEMIPVSTGRWNISLASGDLSLDVRQAAWLKLHRH